jgi:hypothetical protein
LILRIFILVLIFITGCAQQQNEPIFNRKYDSLCEAMNDIGLYALEMHISKTSDQFDHIRKEGSIALANRLQYKGELTSTEQCKDIETIASAQPDKTTKEIYSMALSYFMQSMDPHSVYIPQSRIEEVKKQNNNLAYDAGF